MTTPRERLVLTVLAIIVGFILLLAFVKPHREALGDLVVMPLKTHICISRPDRPNVVGKDW